MVANTAAGLGWETLEPITLPRFDIRIPKDREAARRYFGETDPDFAAIAQCCTPWTKLQNINQRTPQQCRDLEVKREESRDLLCFVEEIVHFQADRLRAVVSGVP